MRSSTESKAQLWMRNWSRRILTSRHDSGLIEHNVTKGKSRENQVLDVLNLLPTALEVAHDVVIIDSQDVESPSFDGVLIDRASWPLLFQDGPQGTATRVAMLESIAVALETKSALDAAEISDIFAKGQRLRTLRPCQGSDGPVLAAFGYECANLGLSFFDFCVHVLRDPQCAPSIVAVLNEGIFALLESPKGPLANMPGPGQLPALLLTGADTLLTFLFYLTDVTSRHYWPQVAEVFKEYSKEFFSSVESFSFDADFLDRLTNADVCPAARACFSGKPRRPLAESYEEARAALGM